MKYVVQHSKDGKTNLLTDLTYGNTLVYYDINMAFKLMNNRNIWDIEAYEVKEIEE